MMGPTYRLNFKTRGEALAEGMDASCFGDTGTQYQSKESGGLTSGRKKW